METPKLNRGEDVDLGMYRCPCGVANMVAIPPDAPIFAKHRCDNCGRSNEFETRETFEHHMSELRREGTADERTRRVRSVNLRKSDALHDELVKIREQRLAALPKVRTPWGEATLLG